jgi:PAS domain S-box-containing protein
MNERLNLPDNERERLEALINFNILEKIPDYETDSVVQMAAQICQTQIAIISIFDGKKYQIKSSIGLNIYDLRGDFDFCFELVKNREYVEVADAYSDLELVKNPMVIGHPNFRFFGAVPITGIEGFKIGTINVIDTKSKQLNREQIEGLYSLSKQITILLNLRKQNKNLQNELNQLLNDRVNQTEIDLAAYKFALDQSSGVAIADRNGFIKFVNDKFCKSSGYIKEELLGQAYSIFNSGHHSQIFFEEMWESISHGELWHGEIRNKDKNGNFFWVDSSIIPFLDKKGKTYQYMAIQQDITEKKSAQERMTLEARLISILSENDSINSSILHIAEQICYRLEWDIGIFWGTNKDQNGLMAHTYYQFTYPHNDELKNFLEAQKIKIGESLSGRVWQKKNPIWIFDMDFENGQVEKTISNTYKIKSSLLFPVLFNNEVIGVMQFLSSKSKKTDVNIIQMFESTGLQIGAFIERKLAEEELLKAKKQAEESVISKDQFLANMSHEIRTPMNAIIGFTELLSQTGLNHLQKDYANSVKVAGENLLSIINDILDFSKIESGVVNIETSSSDVQLIMKNVYDLLKISANQKDLNFSFHFDSNIPQYLMCDALRLNQILINLVGNAIKFTENGSVEFSATLINSGSTYHQVLFKVKDTGIGIQDEKKEKIFERFSQVNNAINRKYEGTGLGLSISKNLIQLMGGELELKSKEGVGSEFHFVLKLDIGIKNETLKEKYQNQRSAHIRKPIILVIEDNYLNQKLAKNVLNNFDFDVELAMNGQIGLEMLKVKNYDLILMDIQMPELDGYQTTKIIRNTLKLNTPIIAMTAHSIVGEKEKCIAAGMNDFISKPFNPDTLYHKIINKLSKALIGNTTEQTQIDSVEEPTLKINLNYLSELSAGNTNFELEMIQLFLKQIPEELQNIEQAIEFNDIQKLRDLCHKVKSSFDIFGLQKASDLLGQLSIDTTNGKDKTELLKQVDNMRSMLEAFYPELEHKIRELQP